MGTRVCGVAEARGGTVVAYLRWKVGHQLRLGIWFNSGATWCSRVPVDDQGDSPRPAWKRGMRIVGWSE